MPCRTYSSVVFMAAPDAVRMTLRRRLRSIGHTDSAASSENGFLVEAALVFTCDLLDLALACLITRVKQVQNMRRFLDDLSVRAAPLPGGLQDGQSIGKTRSDPIVEEPCPIGVPDQTIPHRSPEVERLGDQRLFARATGHGPGYRTAAQGAGQQRDGTDARTIGHGRMITIFRRRWDAASHITAPKASAAVRTSIQMVMFMPKVCEEIGARP